MGKPVGIYGGAFDPPHLAHVDMARCFVAQMKLSALLVVPTGQASHRSSPLAKAAHRLGMCSAAFAVVPGAQVDARETLRQGPSYTIDTLQEIAAEHPGAPLAVLVGQDQWLTLSAWKDATKIVQMAQIVVAVRGVGLAGAVGPDLTEGPSAQLAQKGRGAVLLNWAAQPVSATAARAITAAGGSTSQLQTLVPEAVARYIAQHQLYRS